eukprot:2296279-Rhodomonas_salina.1
MICTPPIVAHASLRCTLALQEAFLDEALPLWSAMMESDPPESLRMPTIVEDPFHLKSIIDDVIKVSSDPETLSSVPFRIDHRRCDLGPSL